MTDLANEIITSHEVERRTFLATDTGRHGPVIVDVVTYEHDSDTRPVITPTYVVEVDGEQRYAGPAHHLDEQGRPPRFEHQFAGAREVTNVAKRDAGGPGLDWCPTCGRRIRDFDEDGMEADDGQRWCQAHHSAGQRADAILARLEDDGILQLVVECERVKYGYPHPGCAEFGPPDEMGCTARATHEISWPDFDGFEEWTARQKRCAAHALEAMLSDLTDGPAPYGQGRVHVAELAR